MNFSQFEMCVIGWAGDRKILKNGKEYTQCLKLISEWGETCDALAKGRKNELKDGIGDCSVVLVILSAMCGVRILEKVPDGLMDGADEQILVVVISRVLSELALCRRDDLEILQREIATAIFALKKLAELNELDYLSCCAHAWAEIQHRRGELNEHGVFIKEEDVEKAQ